MIATKEATKPSQIVFWSLPRSGCHMLEKVVFSKQENLKWLWHPHEPPIYPLFKWLSGDDVENEAEPNRKEYDAKSVESNKKWVAALKEAQDANQTLYMHEHALTTISAKRVLEVVTSPKSSQRPDHKQNFTTIPDEVLLHPGTIPLITIRHPVLAVPSNYRATNSLYTGTKRKNWIVNTSLAFNRDLYDYYVAHGIEPIVADSDDYMSSEAFVRHLTSKLGLDPAKAVVSWPKSTEKEKQDMHPMLLQVQATLVDSEGIKPARASRNIDLEAEREKWKEEFSQEELELMEELVEIAMPHYEYLRERRLRV
ncbi:hypothetical protein PRZ48_011500 [Zasmidium cellare]|uniref:Sulfotransferase n=1 Tax=Zasmidium cellare TaxID=395010 RepID=A0ABR0E751_ZASCE|nr:hypothetical protein PRZ48_011500 [Zasmidium cellare]